MNQDRCDTNGNKKLSYRQGTARHRQIT